MRRSVSLGKLLETCWNIPVSLGYSGLIARAENKAMLELLTPSWRRLDEIGDPVGFPVHALVDTQPNAGNNSLAVDFIPQIVFDHHHPIRDGLDAVSFLDIRTEIAATSSIVFQYLEAAGLVIDSDLATAIFYGIQTDTQGLSRGGSAQDQEIYFKLLAKIDREKLSKVIQAGLPREYFQGFSDGLRAARIYGRTVVAYLGALHRPDFVAEMADTLIRLENSLAVLCMGHHRNVLYISLRIQGSVGDAGILVQRIISPDGKAGGHGTMAGGQIRIKDQSADAIAERLTADFLNMMGEQGKGECLLSSEVDG